MGCSFGGGGSSNPLNLKILAEKFVPRDLDQTFQVQDVYRPLWPKRNTTPHYNPKYEIWLTKKQIVGLFFNYSVSKST